MPFFKYLVLFAFVLLSVAGAAQKIVYSAPSKDDSRRMNFEIIGKVSGNFLIYKKIGNKSYISIYNNEMEETDRVPQEYLPEDRLINVDFFPYPDYSYVIYQYQKKSVVFCNAVRVDGSGKRVSEVATLDTSHLGFASSNRIYSALSSENKKNLMIFKINSKNRSRFLLTTLLLNSELTPLKKTAMVVPMEENNDQLDEFNLDNDGDLIFTKFNRNSNETINSASLVWKPAASDTLRYLPIPQDAILLDEPNIKVDNFNKRYFFTSFYYTKKRGNIEGFYFYVWDKVRDSAVLNNSVLLGEEIRKDARGDANIKMAFNDYFVRNVIIRKDGGFIINTESYYTTSRFNSWNRWNYLYGGPVSSYDYYSYYSPYNSWAWRNRYDSRQNVRHHADNVTVLSFDPAGKLQWSSVIHKEQFDDDTDDRISYLMTNTGSQIHFLFNVDEKRALLLNDYTLSPGGDINHNPTLKNLDRGYEFLPKYGKQVSSTQTIVPCYYRNYICFAKIEFN